MVSAIVLAAGLSTRMEGANKLLLPVGAVPLIARVVRSVAASGAGEVIVVLGHEAGRVRAALDGLPVRFVYNDAYRQGMTTSIQAGVRAASPAAEGFMICLSDLPLIAPHEFDQVIAAFEAAPSGAARIVVPVHAGRRGHPVLFSAHYRADILGCRGRTGCREIVQQNPDAVREVAMATDHVLRDVDTADDFRSIDGFDGISSP